MLITSEDMFDDYPVNIIHRIVPCDGDNCSKMTCNPEKICNTCKLKILDDLEKGWTKP